MKVINLNSPKKIFEEIAVLLLIFTSLILIPFDISFVKITSDIGIYLYYLIDLILLIDIFFNFNFSYKENGILIDKPSLISKHYKQTYFTVDLLANIPFDLIFLIFSDFLVGGIPIVLILRLNRLLRLSRVFRIFRNWEHLSWTNAGYLRIGKFLMVIMLIVHWMACIWFLLPYFENFPNDSWIITTGILDSSIFTQYIRSLYWTIVTMTTVGFGDITPHTDLEHIFTIVVMVMGASTYAFMIGNIASIINKLDSAKVEFWNKIESVNKYLRYKGVPVELNDQVRNYYEYLWAKHRGLQENNFLDDLPNPLKLKIMSELTKDLLQNVPLFKHCSPALKNELLLSLKSQTFAPNNTVAREGEFGREIFFISSGELEILSLSDGGNYGILTAGEYFGDMSMIFNERRTASVKTKTFCEIFILTKEEFNTIKTDYPELKEVLKKVSSEKTEKMAELIIEGIVI